MAEIFLFNIDSQFAKDNYSYYFQYISNEKKERLNRYHFHEDRMRSLYGEIMVRTLIKERIGIDESDIKFSYNEYGKSYLPCLKQFHYNISHSGEWVVCAISSEEIGVDIEKVAGNDISIANRFFTEKEYIDLINMCDDDRLLYFYDLWTLKESYVKCIGRGLNIPFNSFEFKITKENILMYPENNLLNYKIFDDILGYRIAVCSVKETVAGSIKLIDLNECNNL